MSVHVCIYGEQIHKTCKAKETQGFPDDHLVDYEMISIPCDEQFVKNPTCLLVCPLCDRVFHVDGPEVEKW